MADKPDASAPEVISAVFIDMPNVDFMRRGYEQVKWQVLIDHIDFNEIADTQPLFAAAYTHVSHDMAMQVGGYLTRLRRSFNKVGFEVKVRDDKDVDAWIINDIWMSVVKAEQRMYEQNEVITLPFRLRHVLVSGDVGYLRAYESLYDSLGEEEIDIDLVVYSWKDKLSRKLENYASRVVYLDDIEGLDTMTGYLRRRNA